MNRVLPRFRDAPSAAILVAALMVSCIRLFVTKWTSDLDAVAELTVLGALLGLLLGNTRFNRLAVFVPAFFYGLVLIPTVAAWTIYPDMTWPERMVNVGGRLGYSMGVFFSGQPVQDTILFLLFAAILYWTISVMSGYALARTGSLAGAVVPAGLVLILIQLFDSQAGERTVYLALYSFLCLLLLGRLTLVRRQAFWKENRVLFSKEARTSLNLSVVIAALVLVLFAWLAPASARPVGAARTLWQVLTRPLDRAIQDLGNAVAGLEGRQSSSTIFYGDSLGLAQRAENSETVVFTIRLPAQQSAERYYWRARTYDLYQGGEWRSETARTLRFSPQDRPLDIPDISGLIAGEFVFDVSQQSLTQLVTPARPVWVSRPVQLYYSTASAGQLDPLEFDLEPAALAGEQYRVHAAISNPNVRQLQAAGTDYPAWVLDRYLQLPDDLPPGIAELAQAVTAGAASPYEKAEVITRYLRDTITYSDVVPAAPAGEDKLAWFLFEHKAGFCTYYASAEVVMLRSLGIPARLAVGFAEGEPVSWNQRLVRERDAHAWPEVYFPGSGWVEFEPTGSQPALIRPTEAGAAVAGSGTPAAVPTPGEQTPSPEPALPVGATGSGSGARPNTLLRLTWIFLVFVALIVAGFLAYTFGWLDKALASGRRALHTPLAILLRDGFVFLALTPPGWLARRAYFAGLGPIQRSFGVVYQGLRWLGEAVTPSLTPAEAAARLRASLPQAGPDLDRLLGEYQPALYGRKKGDLTTVRAVVGRIRRQTVRGALRRRWNLAGQALKRVFLRRGRLAQVSGRAKHEYRD